MNGRARIAATLAGQPIDRVAAMPITMMWAADLIGAKYYDYATRAEIQAAGQCAVARQFGFDHVSVISDPCCEAADLGATIFYPQNAPPAINEEHALLSSPTSLKGLQIPDPQRTGSRMANRVAAVRLLHQLAGSTHMVEGWVEGPCAESADLRGINALMTDFFDVPDFVHELAGFSVKVALTFAKAQIEAGADLIGVGDAAASLVSRELYDEFILPHERRLVSGIHAAGGKVRLHICGRTTHLLESIRTLDCDIVDLDTLTDLRSARSILGDRQVLLGNVHAVNVVRNGSSEDVRQSLEACRVAAGPAWIAGAGCEIPRLSPPENVRCFSSVKARP